MKLFLNFYTTSLLYITGPFILFIFGWFNIYVAIVLLASLAYLIYQNYSILSKSLIVETTTFKENLILACIAFLFFLLAGVANFNGITPDVITHRAKYAELILNDWPIFYTETNNYLKHYHSFNLFPAFLVKYFYLPKDFTLYVWMNLGYFLAIKWVYILGKKSYVYLLILFLFGFPQNYEVISFFTACLNDNFVGWVWPIYSQTVWVYNQVLPTVIVCSILYHAFQNKKPIYLYFFLIIALFTWAVFTGLAAGIIVAFIFLKQTFFDNYFKNNEKNIIISLIVSCVLFLPILLYFTGSDHKTVANFAYKFYPDLKCYLKNQINIFFPILFYGIVVFWVKNKVNKEEKALLIFIYLFFLLSSFIKIGKYNDYFIRANIVFIFFLHIIILNYLKQLTVKVQKLISLLLLLGCYNSNIINNLRFNYITYTLLGQKYKFGIEKEFNSVEEVLKTNFSEEEHHQYLGSLNSVYYKYLAKKRNF